MAHTFKLSHETIQKIKDTQSALSDEAQEHRDAFDERSENWREGEKGLAVETWLENIGDLADELENVDEEPEA